MRKGWPNFNYKSIHTYVCKCRRLGPRMSASQPFSARICPHRLIIVSLKFGISFHDWNSMSKVLCATREVSFYISAAVSVMLFPIFKAENPYFSCFWGAERQHLPLDLSRALCGWKSTSRCKKMNIEFWAAQKKLRGIN